MLVLYLDPYVHTNKPNKLDNPYIVFGVGLDYCVVDTYKAGKPVKQVSFYSISDSRCSVKFFSGAKND